jgi:hypothetical protein
MIMKCANVDDDTIDETEVKVKKLNRNEALHFENYATLPGNIRNDIQRQLEKARLEYNGRDNENQEEALIHTGIVSIEAAIRQYVQKYEKTAKIKNIVDTFMHKLDALGCLEETKRELAKNRDESAKIVQQIVSIREKIDNAQEAKKFKDAVDDAVVKVNDDSEKVVDGIIKEFQSIITNRIDELKGNDLDVDDAEKEEERLEKFAKQLEPDFEVKLDDLIRNNLVKTSNALIESYRNKLSSLTEEIDIKNLAGLTIDPLKLMGGSVMYGDFCTKKLVDTKVVEDGDEWVKNTDKKWYKPWTWLQEKGYHRKKFKTVKYVNGSELAREFFRPVEQCLSENGDSAIKHAIKQSKKIADSFNLEFMNLDNLLKAKLEELENYATDKEKADERVKETELRLEWLKKITAKVESILEI